MASDILQGLRNPPVHQKLPIQVPSTMSQGLAHPWWKVMCQRSSVAMVLSQLPLCQRGKLHLLKPPPLSLVRIVTPKVILPLCVMQLQGVESLAHLLEWDTELHTGVVSALLPRGENPMGPRKHPAQVAALPMKVHMSFVCIRYSV